MNRANSQKTSAWLTADEIRAAIQLPAGRPDSLLLILEAARIPNDQVIGFAAQQVGEVLEQCPWVCLHAGLLPAPQLISQLKAVASPDGSLRLVLHDGKQVPDFFVLGDGEVQPPDDAINLTGILLLMRLSRHAKVGTGLNQDQFKRIERYIRGRTWTPSRTLDWQLVGFVAFKADRLSDLEDRVWALKSSASDLSEGEAKVVDLLSTWTRDFLRFRVEQLRRRLDSRAQGLLKNIDWLAPSADGDDEAPLGGPALLAPLLVMTGEDSLSDDYREVLATQSTRTRNLLFHTDHAEVMLGAQASAAISLGLQRIRKPKVEKEKNKRSTGERPQASWILTLLTAATGRMPGFLAGIELGGSAITDRTSSRPYLDLSTGVLSLPPALPPNIYRPDRNDARFEHPTEWLELPLPPALVAAIRSFWQTKPVSHVWKWLGGRDPERLIREALSQIEEVHLHTREPAALRKWMQCQLFEAHRDPVDLMVLCGDTFGLSDAALFYHAPSTQALIARYVAIIWPAFKTAAPPRKGQEESPSTTSQDGRFGAASVVKADIVRAGFNVLSGQLNISKSRALQSSGSIIRYHENFTDYLARRLALVTTHRPHESLYAITRSNFSLLGHLAVLQDKRVDPEHFTRLVSTTDTLSRLIVDYLVHLQFLASHPLCSVTAGEYLLGVCRGEHPLIAYLTEGSNGYEARVGSLEDWKRSTPAIWDGLKENFHRAHVLNALREPLPGLQGQLATEVLAQGGHLDAAGHPFDEDSVVAPADFLHPVADGLKAVEQSLGLRHVRGFADQMDVGQRELARTRVMTPPPLASWAEDLAQHEQSRKELLHAQEERVKSTLRNVEQAAEEWLNSELPMVVPDLAKVIKAVVRSDRKAIGADCREVSIPDSVMLELQDRIADISSDSSGTPSALQVAVQNLLSQRIRAAKKRLDLNCMDLQAFRIRYSRGISPFLPRNPVAVDQIHFLRAHLLQQVLSNPDVMPAPVLVAWHLALYDLTLSDQEIFGIATGRLALQHLAGQPGVLITQSIDGSPAVTLAGPAALAAGRFTTGELRQQSRSISTPVALGMQMADFCPASVRPMEKGGFLELLLSTARVAARIEEPGLLRSAAEGRFKSPEATSDVLAAFHSQTRIAPTSNGNDIGSSATIDPDLSWERATPITSMNVPRDLRHDFDKLLYAIRDPAGFLEDASDKRGDEGLRSTRSGPGGVREALELCFPASDPAATLKARLNVVDVLASFTHYLNDRDLRGEDSLAQSSVYDYITDIGTPLREIFGAVNLKQLEEEDFEDGYQRVVEIIRPRAGAQRAHAQLRDFHSHAVRTFGFPQVDIPEIGSSSAKGSVATDGRQLLSDANYFVALSWIVDQLARNDMGIACARWRRALLNAAAVLVLLRRGGLRINECVWLRFRDLFRIGDQWFVLVAPSPFRGLKTASGRRLIRLDFSNDPVGLGLLQQWVEAERLWSGGGHRGKGLLFSHFDNPRHTLGDAVIRRLIQLVFWNSCGIHVVPHEFRHLFATCEWTEAITRGLGGKPAIELIRALDRIRLQIGHARLSTTAEYYIHHLQLLKIQRSSGLPELRSLRPMIEALATEDIATVDKAWQRSRSEEHVCRASESERVRLAVARQSGPIRPAVTETSTSFVPAVPVRSNKPIGVPETIDACLRAVRTREEFDRLVWGLGFTRVAISNALQAIDTLAAAPTHYRMLEASTRRKRVAIVPRPRPYVEDFDAAMLTAGSIPKAEQILAESVRPALLREGLLRVPDDDGAQRAVDDLLGTLNMKCRTVNNGQNRFRVQSVRSKRTLTNSFVWNLATGFISERVSQRS